MQKEHITIIGAGLVGSMMACFLAESGYEVTVFDKRPDPRRSNPQGGRSINLALSHRGWQALKAIGLDNEVQRRVIPMKGRMMHDLTGELTYQPYGQEDQAINSVSRSGLNFTLLQRADAYSNVNFYFQEQCSEIDTKSKVLYLQNTHTYYRQPHRYNILIGADGAFSAIRSVLQKSDRFDYSQHYIGHGYKELTIPATKDGAFAMDPNALHIWPRKSFMLIALPNTDETFTATLFLPYEGEDSFDKLNNKKAVKAFFEEHFPDIPPIAPGFADDFFQNPTSSLVTIRCSPWSPSGDILLIGDAAHAIVPFYGQGMNAGFEDCRLLHETLMTHGGDWSKTIQAFQHKRIRSANAIADLALKNFVEMRDRVADERFLLQKKIEAKLHEAHPDMWVPLYTMVTFTDIDYADAQENGKVQDELMAELLDNLEVVANWEEWDFRTHPLIHDFLQKAVGRLPAPLQTEAG